MLDRLRGIPKEVIDTRRKYEEMVFKLGLLQGDLDLKKSLGKMPAVFYGQALAKVGEIKSILDNLKDSIDQAGKDRAKMRLISDRAEETEKSIGEIEATVKSYIDCVSIVKRYIDRLVSRKQYWERSRSDTVADIQGAERQKDKFEREMKDLQKKIDEADPPVPEVILPLVSQLEALRALVEGGDGIKGLKEELVDGRLKLATCEETLRLADVLERRLTANLMRLESEGERWVAELEKGEDEFKMIAELASQMANYDKEELAHMRELARVLGPAAQKVAKQITDERVGKIIAEHVAKEQSKWIEAGWAKEKVEEESRKLEERLRKEWEPYL